MADPKRHECVCVWARLHRAEPVPAFLLSLFPSLTAASTELPRWRMAEKSWPARWSTIPSAVLMVWHMPANVCCVPTTCKYMSFCLVNSECCWLILRALHRVQELSLKPCAGWVLCVCPRFCVCSCLTWAFHPRALQGRCTNWGAHFSRCLVCKGMFLLVLCGWC